MTMIEDVGEAAGRKVGLLADVADARAAAPNHTIVVVVPGRDEAATGSPFRSGVVLSTEAPLGAVVAALTGGPSDEGGLIAPDSVRLAAARFKITERELEVLRRLSEGAPPQRIARDLGRSLGTVRDHIRSLRQKLDCTSALQVVLIAYRHGMLPHLDRSDG